jgi:plasmid stabilization system protein ParE
MALRIKIAARAAHQVRGAVQWWKENRPAAPNAIALDFGEAVSLLSEQAGIGARYEGARTPDVRRLFLGRVGYFICYRVVGDSLYVLAFWHSSRERQPSL